MIMAKHLISLFLRLFRPLSRITCICLILSASQVEALTCQFTNPFYRNLIIPVIGSGMATVGEDIPVGAKIYTTYYQPYYESTSFNCTRTEEEINESSDLLVKYFREMTVTSTPSGLPILSGDTQIYPTNVPGIGVQFFVTGLTSGTSATFPMRRDVDFRVFNNNTMSADLISRIRIELIKTGPVAPGTHQVLGTSFPTFQISSGTSSPMVYNHQFSTIGFTGVMTMHARTCQLASSVVDVSLGTHQSDAFTGVGSATPWAEFDIQLRDCPAFVGYPSYTYTESQNSTTARNTPNQVAILFTSVHGVVDNNPMLAKLENSPTTAKGIGIEVADRNSATSLNLDGSGGLSLQNLPTEDGSSYTIPLKARYVQYESSVQAGPANGAAVFTITYN